MVGSEHRHAREEEDTEEGLVAVVHLRKEGTYLLHYRAIFFAIQLIINTGSTKLVYFAFEKSV